jgi:hypothetical protein
MEGENPSRRYKWFRPRQAYRGYILLAATHLWTLSLYNSGSSPKILVPRHFLPYDTSSTLVDIALQRGTQGNSGGTISPVVPDTPTGNGTLYSLDTTTAVTPDYFMTTNVLASTGWPLTIPFQVIQSGWSLTFQGSVAGKTGILAILWEEITMDELDYLDW